MTADLHWLTSSALLGWPLLALGFALLDAGLSQKWRR